MERRFDSGECSSSVDHSFEERGLISSDLLVKESPDTSPGLYIITMFVHALQCACWFCMNNAMDDGHIVVACIERIAGHLRVHS